MLDWIKWKLSKFTDFLGITAPFDPAAQVNALIKALECGSYNAAPGSLIQGERLQVEPLDNIWFSGSVVSVIERATGDLHEVFCSCYEKELDGDVMTIMSCGKYKDLKPGEYDVWEVLSYDQDTKQLTRVNVHKKKDGE